MKINPNSLFRLKCESNNFRGIILFFMDKKLEWFYNHIIMRRIIKVFKNIILYKIFFSWIRNYRGNECSSLALASTLCIVNAYSQSSLSNFSLNLIMNDEAWSDDSSYWIRIRFIFLNVILIAGKKGRVLDIRGWGNESWRSVANVAWSSGYTNMYSVGHKGRVDLLCVEPAVGGHYYRSHLPILGTVLNIPDWI